jgi:hypothetical protein
MKPVPIRTRSRPVAAADRIAVSFDRLSATVRTSIPLALVVTDPSDVTTAPEQLARRMVTAYAVLARRPRRLNTADPSPVVHARNVATPLCPPAPTEARHSAETPLSVNRVVEDCTGGEDGGCGKRLTV